MTAADLLNAAKRWTRPDGPARSRHANSLYIPTIDHLASQGWSAAQIRDRIAQEMKLSDRSKAALYVFICRRLQNTK